MARWAAAVSAGLAVLALPAAARAADRWTYAESAHFEVYTTGGDRRAREALAYFERVHAFFEDFMKLAPRVSRPTRLIVFDGERQYAPYRFNEFATAYYLAGPSRDYIVMQSLDERSYPLVVHEYAHLIFRHSGAVYPRWLNEGLAEFFSTITPEDGRMSIGKPSLGRLRTVRESRLMDLVQLFGVTMQSAEYRQRDHAGLFYAESWALAHMLMAGEGYRPRSSAFLQAVAGGLSAAAAFASVYGKSLDVVFADLTAYIRKDRFVFFAADYRDPDPERTFGTRDVDDFESGLITANLLAEHPDRAPAARAAYETLAAQRPDDVELAEARATFEFRRGDAQAAEPLVKKALLLGSRNPQLYGLAARYARSPDERETLFARALELDPANLDVRFAYLDSLMQAREWPKALAVLAVIQPVPADEAYTVFQLRANVLARLGRLEDARAAARRAREFARPGREAEYADRLLQSLDAAGAGR